MDNELEDIRLHQAALRRLEEQSVERAEAAEKLRGQIAYAVRRERGMMGRSLIVNDVAWFPNDVMVIEYELDPLAIPGDDKRLVVDTRLAVYQDGEPKASILIKSEFLES